MLSGVSSLLLAVTIQAHCELVVRHAHLRHSDHSMQVGECETVMDFLSAALHLMRSFGVAATAYDRLGPMF